MSYSYPGKVVYIYASFSALMALIFALRPETWRRSSSPSNQKRLVMRPQGGDKAAAGWLSFFSSQYSLDWQIAAVIFLVLGCTDIYNAYLIR